MPFARVARFLVVLSVAPLLLGGCIPAVGPSSSSAGAPVGQELAGAATQAGPVEIVIWAPAYRQLRGRLDGPVQANAKVTDFDLKVMPVNFDELSESDFRAELARAADAGKGPDIAFVDSAYVPGWASAGYLAPLDECRARYPEFDSVMPSLWPMLTWRDHLWGIPLAINIRLLFFSKSKLKALGWSEAHIAALPGQIQVGEFTLDDLLATAQAATQQGVVPPGFGYWGTPYKGTDFMHVYMAYGGRQYDPQQDKFVISVDALAQAYAFQRRLAEAGVRLDNFLGPEKNTWASRLLSRDTVAHNRVLFWDANLGDWPKWAMDYGDQPGGQDYLFETVGYALRPSGLKGQPGNAGVHLEAYVIASERASGRQNQAAACALLAKTLAPEINARHAAESGTLGVLRSAAGQAAYSQYRLTAETMPMRDFIWPGPWYDSTYRGIIMDFMVRAENGDMAPSAAAAAAMEGLQRELGEALLVE